MIPQEMIEMVMDLVKASDTGKIQWRDSTPDLLRSLGAKQFTTTAGSAKVTVGLQPPFLTFVVHGPDGSKAYEVSLNEEDEDAGAIDELLDAASRNVINYNSTLKSLRSFLRNN